MRAVLKPLEGKYYGTEVEIRGTHKDPVDFNNGFIQIWVMGNYEPSERELEHWRNSEWGGDEPYEISDSHYETETSYEIAKKLVEAVNGRQ